MGRKHKRLVNGAPIKAQASNDFGGGSGYNGANSSIARTTFLGFATNSLTELNSSMRKSLLQKKRALEANFPLVPRIISKIGQHAVGKGVFVRPATRDKAWNDRALALFDEWATNPYVYSIDASRDFWEDQRHVAESVPGEGEFFEALVSTDNGAPMVQPFDPYEVESPWGAAGDTRRWVDGVLTNDFMRPTAYAVRELQSLGSYRPVDWRTVPADSMIHVFDRMRVKQLRGITWLHSAINQGIDVLDLNALITGTAKLHSTLGVTVKKGAKLGRKGGVGKVEAFGDTAPGESDFRAIEKIYGGGLIQYFKEGEDIKLLTSDHPGPNLLEFQKYLMADVATAFRLPYEVVMTLAALGGATARGALEDAQWMFDMIQDMVVWRHSRRVYIWRIAKAMKSGELPRCTDPTWWATIWRGPAKLSVDLGRTAEAAIKLMRAGALSIDRYYEEKGQDPDTELTSIMDRKAWLKKECAARGLNPDEVIESVVKAPAQPPPAKDDREDEEE